MLPGSAIRPGMAIRLEGDPYKVIGADYHAGQGKMGGVNHARLRNLKTGTLREWRFRADEPVEQLALERQTMQFLYADESASYFMNPLTYDQVPVDNTLLGKSAAYLREDLSLSVQFLDGQPVGVEFPEVIEVRVEETAAPSHHQGTDNVWKEAKLASGVQIMVPQFIATGETIRVNVEAGAYVERVRKDKKK